jgi:hypothetical protein
LVQQPSRDHPTNLGKDHFDSASAGETTSRSGHMASLSRDVHFSLLMPSNFAIGQALKSSWFLVSVGEGILPYKYTKSHAIIQAILIQGQFQGQD